MKAEVRDSSPSNKPHQSLWDQAAAKSEVPVESEQHRYVHVAGKKTNKKPNKIRTQILKPAALAAR